MKPLANVLVATGLVLATVGTAAAAEVVITQNGKKFDQKTVTISKGDTIKFVNDDSIAHNIHSRSPGGEFDLGVQKPGSNSNFTFAKDGTFKVRCAIHPKMKVTVTVK